MEASGGIITAHYIYHWGPPSAIRPRNVPGLNKFAVLVFPPRRGRTSWRLATNGMSAYVQEREAGGGIVCSEVFASATTDHLWIDDLLAAIAAYPRDCQTYLSVGDTITVGRPIDQKKSIYAGILLLSPTDGEPQSLELSHETSSPVQVLQAVGLLPVEVEDAERSGRFDPELVPLISDRSLDTARRPVSRRAG